MPLSEKVFQGTKVVVNRWLKLGSEVGCNEIFEKSFWLTSVTFSFGVTGGSHFLPFEHQTSSLPGGILKV